MKITFPQNFVGINSLSSSFQHYYWGISCQAESWFFWNLFFLFSLSPEFWNLTMMYLIIISGTGFILIWKLMFCDWKVWSYFIGDFLFSIISVLSLWNSYHTDIGPPGHTFLIFYPVVSIFAPLLEYFL